jgi:hypothetical protein
MRERFSSSRASAVVVCTQRYDQSFTVTGLLAMEPAGGCIVGPPEAGAMRILRGWIVIAYESPPGGQPLRRESAA